MQVAIAYLKDRGFKIQESSEKNIPIGQKRLIASKFDRYKVVLTEETRAILETRGGEVASARGWLFLHGF